jgi:cytochrome b561
MVMSNAMLDEELYKRARQRFKDKMDFYHHCIIYAVVNGILALAWAFSTDIDHPFFIWASVPWGIGLLIHFLMVFIFSGKTAGKRRQVEGEERVDKKKGFYRHLGLYLLVNIILIIIWVGTGAESDPVPWFIYPLGGWGFFVLWNFLEVYILVEETGWQKRQIEKEIEKLKRAGR